MIALIICPIVFGREFRFLIFLIRGVFLTFTLVNFYIAFTSSAFLIVFIITHLLVEIIVLGSFQVFFLKVRRYFRHFQR